MNLFAKFIILLILMIMISVLVRLLNCYNREEYINVDPTQNPDASNRQKLIDDILETFVNVEEHGEHYKYSDYSKDANDIGGNPRLINMMGSFASTYPQDILMKEGNIFGSWDDCVYNSNIDDTPLLSIDRPSGYNGKAGKVCIDDIVTGGTIEYMSGLETCKCATYKPELKRVVDANENFTVVEGLPNKNGAEALLKKIEKSYRILETHLLKKYPDNVGVNNLKRRFNVDIIKELKPKKGSSETSSVVNKGKKFTMCLRDKENMGLHDYNTVMFVFLHEISHIMSDSYGHNDEFISNFRMVLEEADNIGVWNSVDYSKNPVHYCGVDITNNPIS